MKIESCQYLHTHHYCLSESALPLAKKGALIVFFVFIVFNIYVKLLRIPRDA